MRAMKYARRLIAMFPEHSHRFQVVEGTKHLKILLDGRLVQTVPANPDFNGRAHRNAVAQLRRSLCLIAA